MNHDSHFSIWNSMALMTAIDVVIIALACGSLLLLKIYWKDLKQFKVLLPVLFLLFSLLLLGAFYLADLYIMWILPEKVGMPAAMAKMRALHLEFSWITNLVVCMCIFFGLSQIIRKLLINSHELKITNETLDKQLLELRKLSTAVNASNASIIITDRHGHIEYVNPGFIENYGYQKKEVVGQHIKFLMNDENTEEENKHILNVIKTGKPWKGTLQHKCKDGTSRWNRINVSSVLDHGGKVSHFISIHEDVTREYEITEKLNYQAKYDHLTGLLNRFEFEQRLIQLLDAPTTNRIEHALCYMDLDQFKVVNDTCGHAAGDELLQQLTLVLQDAIRKTDVLARLGGDEFAILMQHCSLNQAERVIKVLQEAVHKFQFVWEGQIFRVGISIGLLSITDNRSSISELMKRADMACYMAKDMGRNRVHIYNKKDEALIKHEGEMQEVTRIYNALENNSFLLYAQAIESMNKNKPNSYELLLRMQHENGHVINPINFLPAAERFNLISKLDRWVIEYALTEMQHYPEFIEQIEYVSINLSGQTFADEGFLDFVLMTIRDNKINANKICFEITETAAISNIGMAKNFILNLKKIGCLFSLDDFGSGLSSFAYLKSLQVDYLKIDGLFVKDIVEDAIDHAMVKSINQIAQVMGIQTIAEFVENDVIKGMLQEIGVDYVQGHGIGQPILLQDLLKRTENVTSIKKSL